MGARPRRQIVDDARAMRALAHPLRVALLEAMRRDGEITATRAAELLDESPGNMSWHLQTLAKYGFVEETGHGRGRARPWRLTSASHTFETGMADPERALAGEALERTFLERTTSQLREWWSRRLTYPEKWRRTGRTRAVARRTLFPSSCTPTGTPCRRLRRATDARDGGRT
jgi:DNA-binding transcriptional ArsR family regulator